MDRYVDMGSDNFENLAERTVDLVSDWSFHFEYRTICNALSWLGFGLLITGSLILITLGCCALFEVPAVIAIGLTGWAIFYCILTGSVGFLSGLLGSFAFSQRLCCCMDDEESDFELESEPEPEPEPEPDSEIMIPVI